MLPTPPYLSVSKLEDFLRKLFDIAVFYNFQNVCFGSHKLIDIRAFLTKSFLYIIRRWLRKKTNKSL